MFKKFLSAILSLSLIFSLAAPAFAAEPEGNITYTTVINEENQTVQAILENTVTGEITYGPVVSYAEETSATPLVFGADIHQDTFLNFEYDIWTTNPREWNLERPSQDFFGQYYFRCYENSSNAEYLRTWKDDVDALNSAEWAAIPLIGMAGFNIVKAAIASYAAITTGGVLTAGAIASIKAAGKWSASAAIAVGVVCSTYNNCALSYSDVLNHTDNYHYDK